MEILVDSTRWLFHPLFPGRIGIWKCWFLWKEKNPRSRDENQQQTQPTYDAETGNRTRATSHQFETEGINLGLVWLIHVSTFASFSVPRAFFCFRTQFCDLSIRRCAFKTFWNRRYSFSFEHSVLFRSKAYHYFLYCHPPIAFTYVRKCT